MANYSTNLSDWGATGSSPPTDYKYEETVPPVDAYDNYVTSNLISDIKHLISVTNSRLESGSGTSSNKPSSPESGQLYYDTDNQQLEIYDATNSSWSTLLKSGGATLTGALDMNGSQIKDSNGALTIAGDVNVTGNLQEENTNVATETWVDNNADVPNADYADSAGDASSVGGTALSGLVTDSEVEHTNRSFSPGSVSSDAVVGQTTFTAISSSVLAIICVEADGRTDDSASEYMACELEVDGSTAQSEKDFIADQFSSNPSTNKWDSQIVTGSDITVNLRVDNTTGSETEVSRVEWDIVQIDLT